MKTFFLSLIIIIVLAASYYFDIFSFTNTLQIRDYILSYGNFAPIVFIVLFTIVPLTLFPDSILAIAGGLIFGLYEGTIYIMIGALFGSTLSFYISRQYGSWLKEKLKNEKFLDIDKNIKKNGFLIIFLLRLIPLVPFDIISYSAGFSSIKYKDFILATFIGIIPGVVVFANIGSESLNLGTKSFYFSIACLLGLIVISMMFKNRMKKRFYENT